MTDFHPLLAANVAAFFIVFGVFVIALVVLTVLTVKWVLARDKPARDAWKQRHFDAHAQAAPAAAPPDPPRPPVAEH